MKEMFITLGIEVTENQLNKFERYFKLLIEYNKKFNLTAITEKKEVYIKNFIDSILFLEQFKKGKVIDIGSGGGFPAIPLKIMNDNLEFTLLEATGKKCEFLKTIVNELKLEKVTVINGRAEEYAFNKEFRERFDYCTSRAVSRLNTLTEYCLPFVKVGGKMMAFKGKAREEVEESLSAISILGGKLETVIEKDLFSLDRSLVIIEKVEKTNEIYPRINSKIKKYPL